MFVSLLLDHLFEEYFKKISVRVLWLIHMIVKLKELINSIELIDRVTTSEKHQNSVSQFLYESTKCKVQLCPNSSPFMNLCSDA